MTPDYPPVLERAELDRHRDNTWKCHKCGHRNRKGFICGMCGAVRL